MKIVKFKDGRYGVRKWCWYELGYVFYHVKDLTGLCKGEVLGGFWSILDERGDRWIKHETYASALSLYRAINAKDKKDTGTPVKEQI